MENKISHTSLLIIGSGIAALSAAETYRKYKNEDQIKMVSREKWLPYYRPSITKKLVTHATAESALIKNAQWYQEHRINVELEKTAIRIHPENQEVIFDDGSIESYNHLLIATGANAFIPPFPGSHLSQVMALREFSDIEKLYQILDQGKLNIVVIGGGLLGLEMAESLITLNHTVSIIEVMPTLLSQQLDVECSQKLQQNVESKCHHLSLGIGVEAILGETYVTGVKLKDGSEIPADLVIVSAGVRANVKLAESAKLPIRRGILCNEWMQTENAHIYTAGDCAERNGCCCGLWESAMNQGKTAGAHMAGVQLEIPPTMLTPAILSVFGVQILSIGDIGKEPDVQYQTQIFEKKERSVFQKYYLKNNIICGGILFHSLPQGRLLQKAIQEHLSWEETQTFLKLIEK